MFVIYRFKTWEKPDFSGKVDQLNQFYVAKSLKLYNIYMEVM